MERLVYWILAGLTTVILAFEVGNFAVHGWFLRRWQYPIVRRYMDLTWFVSPRMMHFKPPGCYAAQGRCLLSKWYVDGLGRIPRWSSLHGEMNRLHRRLLEEQMQVQDEIANGNIPIGSRFPIITQNPDKA